MNQKSIYHARTTISRVPIWAIAVPAVISGGIYVAAIRHNNIHMIQLREAVYQADQSGKDVEGALTNLRTYVYRHMNTKLTKDDGVYPPIQLKYTYQRLQEAEKNRTTDGNAEVYTEAQAYCEGQNSTSFSGRSRVPCIEAYVSEHGGEKARSIPSAMYKFDFVSPRWSPDLAGYSMITTILLFVALGLRLTVGLCFRLLAR